MPAKPTPAEVLERERGRARRDSLEARMSLMLKAYKLDDGCVREWAFMPGRQFRFDFAWPALLLAIEVEGGVNSGGRHVRGPGFTRDCEKMNEAALLGWLVLRVTPEHLGDGRALGWVLCGLEQAKRVQAALFGV